MSVTSDRPRNDIALIALGCASVVVAVGIAIAESLHVLPSGLAVVLVIAFASIGIRIMFRLRARRSSALSNPKVINVVSLVLLGISFVAASVDIGVAIAAHNSVLLGQDLGYFFQDLFQHAYSGLILLVVAVLARTVGWRSILGVLLAGLLAVSSLALVITGPIVTALGAYNQLVVAFLVPLTEEVLKALPVVLVAILAVRNVTARPSAVDFGLLGYASGMGFALIESADYGRLVGAWDAAPPLSYLFPSTEVIVGFVSSGEVAVGHAVWSGFIGLAIGFGVLYRRRFRFAWVVIPVAFALAVIEHCLANADLPPVVLQVLIAKGNLVGVLFLLGMIAAAVFERRPLRSIRDLRAGVWLTPESLAAQRASLAARQRARMRTAVGAEPVAASASNGGAR